MAKFFITKKNKNTYIVIMKTTDFSKWNEFDWENELRLDDARINAYIKELPRYIDLPREDELLLKRMQHNTELVSQNINWDDTPYNAIFDEGQIDEDFFNADDWKERDGADIFLALQKLASDWMETYSRSLKKNMLPDGLVVITVFGKITARLADIIDLDREPYNQLKIALAKRVINEFNNIIGIMSALGEKYPEIESKVDEQLSHIQVLREKTVDLIYQLRNKSKK